MTTTEESKRQADSVQGCLPLHVSWGASGDIVGRAYGFFVWCALKCKTEGLKVRTGEIPWATSQANK